jgi:alpha-1,6-mannosyltransferase
MDILQAATPISPAGVAGRGGRRRGSAGAVSAPGARALGTLGLLGILASVLLLCAGAASAPTQYVPSRVGGWPSWLAGPLGGLSSPLGSHGFQNLTLLMCVGYALVLAWAWALPMRALVAAIVAAHVILLLGPPLVSQDVFGYLGYARLGALHGLDPYSHIPAEAPADAVFPFVGWPFKHSPYGPLFTLASYALAPLGVAGGLWALKTLAAVAGLAAIALVGYAAHAAGRPVKWPVAFVGLNPVLLELALGGAHNDTLVMASVAAALALAARGQARERAAKPASAGPGGLRASAVAVVAGMGVKIVAGVVLPFVVLAPRHWRERARVLAGAVLALAALAAVGLIGFGSHALGFLGALGEQQQLVATHSVPAETARLVGLSGTPAWWRHLYLAGFCVVLALTMWRTLRGADWRVMAGWAMLALLVSTAWLLPWYAIWLLPLAALGGNRRLCAATLLFCTYAILIHLPLADPLLSPAAARSVEHVHIRAPGVAHRLELTSFEVLHNVQLDLRW